MPNDIKSKQQQNTMLYCFPTLIWNECQDRYQSNWKTTTGKKKQWHPKNKGQYSSFTYDKELRCGEEINEGGKTRQPVELESYCHRGCSVIFKPFFRITFKLRIVLFKKNFK